MANEKPQREISTNEKTGKFVSKVTREAEVQILLFSPIKIQQHLAATSSRCVCEENWMKTTNWKLEKKGWNTNSNYTSESLLAMTKSLGLTCILPQCQECNNHCDQCCQVWCLAPSVTSRLSPVSGPSSGSDGACHQPPEPEPPSDKCWVLRAETNIQHNSFSGSSSNPQ